jgi:hypothetical protein
VRFRMLREKTNIYSGVAAKYTPGGEKMTETEIDAILSKWFPLNRPGFLDDVSEVIAFSLVPSHSG